MDEPYSADDEFDQRLEIVDSIVDSVADLYREQFSRGNVYYLLESGYLGMKELLAVVARSFRFLLWQIDKEELARNWHNQIVIPHRRRPEDFTDHLTNLRHNENCMITLLDPRLINLLTEHVPVDAPRLYMRDGRPMERIQSPTHEVMLTTIWNDWLRETDIYLKRLIIPKHCTLTTLLLGQVKVAMTGSRYAFTWIPHIHSQGVIWNGSRNVSEMRFIPRPFSCREVATCSNTLDINCLIWNSGGAAFSVVLGVLHYLLMHENAHLVIVTETFFANEDVPNLASSSGYEGFHVTDAEEDWPGMWILFRPAMVTVTKKPSFRRSLHVLIKARDNPIGRRNFRNG